ncbi:MAG: LysR family transcriptional regulator [Lacisediminihabitans sp.]
MELGQLRALRELGDRGSIAAVAAALYVTPSSVSQQISALQRSSPVPLTYKSGRRTALTDAGKALASAVVEVEVALERANQAIARFQDEPTGIVSVAAFHSVALMLFRRLLATDSVPDQPQLALNDFDVAQDAFPALTRTYDLVIAHRLTGSPDWPASVRVEPLLFEPLDVVVRRGHRLADKVSLDREDLRDQDWVTVHQGFPLEGAIAHILGIGGVEARIVHRINEYSIAATVVAASNCVALMPRYTANMQNHPELVLKPLTEPGPGRNVDVLSRPETLERANVRTVMAQLRAAIASFTPSHGG